MDTVKQYERRTFSSLKIRNFKLYFIGQCISLSGSWMQNVAQGLLVLQMTGSGTALGILIALQFLPILLFGSYGGVIADRFPKRTILFFTQSIAGLLAVILAALVALDAAALWNVYMLAFALGLVTAVDNPTRQTFIFEMVGKEHIRNAVSLNSVMINLARVVGPSLAGILVPTVGLAACFLLNGLSFLAFIIVLTLMRMKEMIPGEKTKQMKGQLKEGLKYVQSQPALRNIILMMVIIGTFTFEFPVILPLIAEFTFNNAVTGYALLTSTMALGAICGGLYSANIKKGSIHMLIKVAVFFGIAVTAAAVAPSLYIAAVLMLAVGFFSSWFLSQTNAMLQIKSAPEMRGRVMSLWTVAFLGTTPIGGPIVGFIGEAIGPRWGLAVGGIAAVAAGAMVYFLMKRDEEQVIPAEVELAKDHALSDRHVNMR